jgi:hypothetical protein
MAPDASTLASIASVIAAFGSAMIIFRVLLIILPVSADFPLRSPAAVSAASAVVVAGYLPSLLAHYRIVLGSERRGSRHNPEPIELVLVLITAVAALVVGAWVYYRVAI